MQDGLLNYHKFVKNCTAHVKTIKRWFIAEKMFTYDKNSNLSFGGSYTRRYIKICDAKILVRKHRKHFSKEFIHLIDSIAVPVETKGAWAMYEVDAKMLFRDGKFNKIYTYARPNGDVFEVDFCGKRACVPQSGVCVPRGFDVNQTYKPGDQVEVFVMFEKFQAWVRAFVMSKCKDELLYMVMFMEYYEDRMKGMQTVAASRMRKIHRE
jgi:hypothetical protein